MIYYTDWRENMAEIIKTPTGTLVIAGTEYNEYPPPQKLFRVMKRCWAEELKNKGSIRFGNLEESSIIKIKNLAEADNA